MNLQDYLSSTGVTQIELGSRLGITSVLIYQWKAGVRPIPEERCPPMEFATDGKVTCEELRPDVTWVRVPDAEWPNPSGRPLVDHMAKTIEQAKAA